MAMVMGRHLHYAGRLQKLLSSPTRLHDLPLLLLAHSELHDTWLKLLLLHALDAAHESPPVRL